MTRDFSDVVIVGGGIVGLATAYQLLLRFPRRTVTVVEKERELAEHQTGHNSGVLHSGIYYQPGSLKATNCRAGKLAMEAFCREHDVPFEICGKVIVATRADELPALEAIARRGEANGVRCQRIGPERLRELEPHAAGVQALHVPDAGIVDYRQVCRRLGKWIEAREGGSVRCGWRVLSGRLQPGGLIAETTRGPLEAGLLVNCGGLHCDRVARASGTRPEAKIIPFRGEYYEVRAEKRHLCRNLIYPVPDSRFPFLGVHFTRMIGGGLECGPNAVLAFSREGYTWRRISLRDLAESLGYRGFRRMARKYWRMGLSEMWRSFSKRAFVRALQRLVPEIAADDLHSAPAGVRAQAVRPDGGLVDDFQIAEGDRAIHIINAPSPAATASLNIGRLISDRVAARWS